MNKQGFSKGAGCASRAGLAQTSHAVGPTLGGRIQYISDQAFRRDVPGWKHAYSYSRQTLPRDRSVGSSKHFRIRFLNFCFRMR